MISTNLFLPIILLLVTPSANRNTYSVATLIIHIPRVEALRTSTLGYEIATPTELPRVRTINDGLLISLKLVEPGIKIHPTSMHTNNRPFMTYAT